MILEQRGGLIAVDANPVNGRTITFYKGARQFLWFAFSYSTTGTPATIGVRCGIETSADGTNWHQCLRFVDQSVVGGATRIAKLQVGSADFEEATAASNLNNAAAAAVFSGQGHQYFRAVTKLQTLTGGTAPTVDISVYLSE